MALHGLLPCNYARAAGMSGPRRPQVTSARPLDRCTTGVLGPRTSSGPALVPKAKCNLRYGRVAATQQAGGPEPEPGTEVRIVCKRAVPFGSALKLVGEHPALGQWDSASALGLTWNEGHEWRGAVSLPAGDHEFKCVILDSSGQPQEWEQGGNRTVSVKAGVTAISLDCSWGADTAVQEHTAPEASPASTASTPAADSTSSEDNAAGSKPAEDLQDSEQPTGMTAFDDALEQAATDGVLGAEEDSDGKAYDASALISLAPTDQDDSSKRAELQNQAAPVAGSEADGGTDAQVYDAPSNLVAMTNGDSGNDSPMAGSEGRGEESTSQPTSSSQPVQAASQAQASTPSTSEGQVPAWLSGLGLAALPVVAWSQYSLFQTGCGLPPGPSGSLGAAEGVGYLSVLGLACWGLYARTAARRAASAGWQSLVETASAGLVISGLAVLGYQVQTRGYVPAALPDSRCHGPGAANQANNVFGGLASAPALSSAAQSAGDAVQGLADQLTQSSSTVLSSVDLSGAVNSVGEAGSSLAGAAQSQLQEVSNGLRGLVSLQQEQRAQVQYGAADGLSAADISAVVDEAGAVAHRLRQGLDQLWRSFATPAAVSPRALQAANSSSGLFPLPLATLPTPISLLSNWSPCSSADGSADRVPLVVVSFGAAATNAVTAANNVTVNINTAVMQLQQTVDSVRSLLNEATGLAQEENVDLSQVNGQLELLQQALCSAQHATQGLNLQPLVLQLRDAADAIRHSESADDVARADDLSIRLENAASSLSKAAEMADPQEIEAARLHIINTFPPGTYFTASNTKPSQKPQVAAPVDSTSLAPAVAATEKAAGQLQAVVEELHDADASLAPLESAGPPVQEQQ